MLESRLFDYVLPAPTFSTLTWALKRDFTDISRADREARTSAKARETRKVSPPELVRPPGKLVDAPRS